MADRGSYSSYGSEGPATAVAEQPLPLSADKKKPVLVTGANGLVGIHTCRELSKNGWQVRALIRDPAKAAMALGQLPVEFRVGDVRDATALRSSLNGCGAVVHLAAIAIEKKGDTYQESNTAATERLISAARAENVQRVVFMSQNGADSRSPYPFLHSKGVAQDSIKTSGLRWTVLRPSVIFGPDRLSGASGLVSRTLAGFRSRWTIRWSWACWTARASTSTMPAASRDNCGLPCNF